MYCKQSEISFVGAIETVLHNFGAIKIYYNNELVWDDSLSIDDGWMPPHKAIERFKRKHPRWRDIIVYSVKIDIVEWHHSIIKLKGKTL